MQACHVLLGRPWQFDKQTIHDGLTNEITFTHNNKKFVLHPLTPTQVLEDQVQMKNKLNNERKSKTPRNHNLSIKDTVRVWELGVPSHKVTQKESLLTKNSLKTCLLIEQPPYLLLCKEHSCVHILIKLDLRFYLLLLKKFWRNLMMYFLVMVLRDCHLFGNRTSNWFCSGA